LNRGDTSPNEAIRDKTPPLSDTALAGLEPDANEYRELDGSGLYFRVKPDGQKSWQLRYKKPDGKWSWLGLGGYETQHQRRHAAHHHPANMSRHC
jgi:hypothetical protein